ncbi:MAG TPA: bifunctional adenosylcobinamide kinase/adenosylcobinamide-phosphate guanylyltransferase [Dehalococcoidia bacterium]
MGALTFITGGARSGKSRLAERLASRASGPIVYLATLEALDDEMRRRVTDHRNARPAAWRTVEEPLEVIDALDRAGPYDACVFDCVTLWLSNLLLRDREPLPAVEALIEWQAKQAAALIVVSNEVGSGVVPEYELGRRFRDALGEANQLLSAAASEAYVCVAGRAIDLRALGKPIDAS